jgi:hypothetical protein
LAYTCGSRHDDDLQNLDCQIRVAARGCVQ